MFAPFVCGPFPDFDDLEAGTHIEHLVAEFHKESVEYFKDNEKTEKFSSIPTVIMLGSPLANSRARTVFEFEQPPYFEWIEQKEDHKHKAAMAIRNKVEDKTYDSAKKIEYAMVLRVPNRQVKGGYFFLVAGAHGTGTIAAGKYLRNHWQKFKNADQTAGVLLVLPRKNPDLHRVEKQYGFRKKRNREVYHSDTHCRFRLF